MAQPDETPNPDALLDTQQAARFLHVAPGSMQNWRVLGGGPPFVRLRGRLIRYCMSDLRAFIASGRARNTAEADARAAA